MAAKKCRCPSATQQEGLRSGPPLLSCLLGRTHIQSQIKPWLLFEEIFTLSESKHSSNVIVFEHGGPIFPGARWDTQAGVITEARLKDLTPAMPVISVRAVPNDRQETRNIYECPLYKTKIRGPTYVWTLSLKTRERPAKWVLAGVALLLSV